MNARSTGLEGRTDSTADGPASKPDLSSNQRRPGHGEGESYAIRAERVDVQVGEGPPMDAYLAQPAVPGPFPGVLVAMELFGVDAAVRDVCDRLGGLGVAA